MEKLPRIVVEAGSRYEEYDPKSGVVVVNEITEDDLDIEDGIVYKGGSKIIAVYSE